MITAIRSIASQFENKTLPKQEWTHHAHIAVALVHIYHYKTVEQTLPVMRERIKAYNLAVGTENTDHSGYHETLTIFWLQVVHEYYKAAGTKDIDEIYQDIIKTPLATGNFPAQFYSDELLFSKTARQYWAEPDLKEISAIKSIVARQFE
jgi:hypothetical protein